MKTEISKFTSVVFCFLLLQLFPRPSSAELSSMIGETVDPEVSGSGGNCFEGDVYIDLNGNSSVDSDECWRGLIVRDGKVGIGTSNPKLKLEVNGNASVSGRLAIGTSPANNPIIVTSPHSGHVSVFDNTSTSNSHGVLIKTNTSVSDEYALDVRPNGVVGGMILTNVGNLGIGTASPSYKLHVNGTVAGTGWVTLSSRAYKKDIVEVSASDFKKMLADIKEMKLATYKYKEKYGGDGATKLGFLSEDMPEQVLSLDKNGIDMYKLLAMTIGALKAQQQEIDSLKNIISTTKK